MADTSKKCAHPACLCTVPANEKYCSNTCKDAGDMVEIECNCGHPACAV
jgi:metallothionein